MSTASALGIACSSGWVVEDRHGVRRARVLDPHGVLWVGGVGLVHHQQPAERVGATVRVEHGARAAGPAVVEVQCTAGDGAVGDATRADQPEGGGAGRRHDLDRVVESGRCGAGGAGKPEQGQGACRDAGPGQHRTPRPVGPRRVPATLVELCADRIRAHGGSLREKYPHGGKSNPWGLTALGDSFGAA